MFGMDNTVICGDAVEVLSGIQADHFDLTVFSPPYDNLRDYKGYSLDLHSLGEQLFRVTKDGGVVVMVIQDQTISGRKSLTSFRTMVDWCDSIGFGLWECPIYRRHGKDGGWWKRRLRVDHEYMPVFIKGDKPTKFDKESIKIPSKHSGKTVRGGCNRNKDGTTADYSEFTVQATKCPGTVWDIANGGDKVFMKRKHPAAYPDELPYRFIKMFTEQGDIVLDPMVGSGSTAVTAKMLGRRFFGVDVSDEYCALARQRVETMQTNMMPGFQNLKQAPERDLFSDI